MSPSIEIAEARADAETAARLSGLIAELFAERGLIVATREGRDGSWRIEVILPEGLAWAAVAPLIAELHTAPLPVFRLCRLDRDAWAAAPKPALDPVRAGRFLVHDRSHRSPVRRGGTAVEIEAGLAFGTGHHATTAGCLLALDRALKSRRFNNVLDLGCGTAILAIAAAKAARAPVLATDIDPVAVAVARKNAARNAILPLVAFRRADGLRDPVIAARAPFDLVMANILAGPLERFAKALAGFAAPGASVILSGLLTRQAERVAARYRDAGFMLRERLVIKEWATLTLEVPGPPSGREDAKT
jgi:ribosomal protein L11 methyltransferase